MPELPEVETIRRQLAPRLEGRVLVEASSHPSVKFVAARDATGAGIDRVGRRGKYLMIDLDDDRVLVVHLGMTGNLRVRDPGRDPIDAGPSDPHVRATWSLDDGAALVFRDVRRFGRIAVLPAHDHSALPTLAALGPEPFDDAFTPDGLWRAALASRRAVKTLLLSQRPVAGVGNIYADEALWRARVHPAARHLTRPQARRLHQAIRDVLDAGLVHGGTTLRDYVDANGSQGEHQLHLHAYGRAGEPCERCGTALRRRVIDARTSTFCPRCQRVS
jgi:formamidopyrimidine-DNA glycosylase